MEVSEQYKLSTHIYIYRIDHYPRLLNYEEQNAGSDREEPKWEHFMWNINLYKQSTKLNRFSTNVIKWCVQINRIFISFQTWHFLTSAFAVFLKKYASSEAHSRTWCNIPWQSTGGRDHSLGEKGRWVYCACILEQFIFFICRNGELMLLSRLHQSTNERF